MSDYFEGFYSIFFSGSSDEGMGVFVFKDGIISGADIKGIIFDGEYPQTQIGWNVSIQVSVPPHTTLIQGVTVGSKGLKYEIFIALPENFLTNHNLTTQTPLREVNFKLTRIRGAK